MIAGMDFGTTHSGMAIYDGHELRSIPLNVLNSKERVTPTILYITNEQKVAFGREAMNTYFEHNLGRPTKMERVWVGEISQTFAELPTFVRDVYIWIDVLSPGRLFLSFKTDLSDSSYAGTAIGRFFYTLEDITTTYLYLAKRRAEQFLGIELDEIVLGRPVKFNEDPEADTLAQARLLEAALQAGYKKVYFQPEPIAAAHYYEMTMTQAQNVLVFDFGGGTLDVTIMRLGDPRERRVLATGGVPIAGDIFDRKIVRAKVPKHFGEGSLYRSMDKKLPVPSWIYDAFADWRTMLTLQTPENMQILRTIAPAADKRRQIEALIRLVSSNYSLKLYEIVEQAKRKLSTHTEAVIGLQGEGFLIREPITRQEFEQIIMPEYRIIERHLDETVYASGLRPNEIDVVIRTGGSSQIPLFQQLLAQKFGAAKVKAIDIFGSVTSGLGVIAQGIASGAITAKGYTESPKTKQEAPTNVPPVNLDLLKKQMAWQTGAIAETEGEAKRSLTLLSRNYQLTVVEYAVSLLEANQPRRVTDFALPLNPSILTIASAALDEQLLLITSAHRFLLVTPRELIHYQEANLTIADVQRFERSEQICLVRRWAAVKHQTQLVLVSTQGHARKFDMAQLRPLIEGPTPTRIDWALPGWPKVVIGAELDQTIVLANNLGRAVRVPVDTIRRTGSRIMPKQKNDEIIGGYAVDADSWLWLLSTEGYTKWLCAGQLPIATEASPQALSIVRRRGEICGLIRPGAATAIWAISSARVIPLDPEATPRAIAESTAMHKTITLAAKEQVVGIISLTTLP
ncbi:MAG: Hsp70 family protein [Chloroflexi bacterium]|nr:Hsp70 family protein [Chloroflexota bacterium]